MKTVLLACSLRRRLVQVAFLFLKLGTIAFGGPAAHIAMMEDEVVRRRNWLSREDFLDLVGATNLIPGPNSTELAIHIGYRYAGWPGLVVAGLCFILPAVTIVWGMAWAYVRFGSLPEIQHILYGIKPVMIAIVIGALWRLGKTALKTKTLLFFFLMAMTASVLGVNEVLIIFGIGALAILWHRITDLREKSAGMKIFPWLFSFFMPGTLPVFASPAMPSKLTELFLVFMKIGTVLFGSGYVLLAFLQADFVDHRQWLTQSQLLDAVAVGQFTPGPVFTAATFVGYLIAGNQGALWATLGIFIPAFIFVALSGPLIPRIKKSALAGSFLSGVNVASLALMVAVSWQLGKSALVDWPTVFIAAASFSLLISSRLNSTWLVLAGGVIGLVHSGI